MKSQFFMTSRPVAPGSMLLRINRFVFLLGFERTCGQKKAVPWFHNTKTHANICPEVGIKPAFLASQPGNQPLHH